MINFAINHMTVPQLSYHQLLATAKSLGCVGVEVRNDLQQALFADMSAEQAGVIASDSNLRLLALAELSAFTQFSKDTVAKAQALIQIAKRSGVEGVVLIPRCDGKDTEPTVRKANLRTALSELKPLFVESGLTGFVEPLGFEHSSLRSKAETVEAIEHVGGKAVFKLVHDTFHHYLEASQDVFADYTGMVHVSGVVDTTMSRQNMRDQHRVLVDKSDRLENVAQLRMLIDDGYVGPVSMEAFAPEIHALAAPGQALAESFAHISMAVDGLAIE